MTYLILAVIGEIFDLTLELAIPIGIPAIEIKVEIETHPVVAESKRSNWSM